MMGVTVGQLERSELYSEDLGIDLSAGRDSEYFRWFLASILFGGRIVETVARHTFAAFMRHDLRTPQKILAAGWDFLVNPIMREGGYVRYDGRKSTQVQRDCQQLLDRYGGKLSALHAAAESPPDLEARLCDFYGIGPVTTNIFLRELRPFWRLADPAPLPAVEQQARLLDIDLSRYPRKSMVFTRVEAGLIRLRHHRPLLPMEGGRSGLRSAR